MKHTQNKHAITHSAKKLAQHMSDVLHNNDLFDLTVMFDYAKTQLESGWPELYADDPRAITHDASKVIELALRDVYTHMNNATLDAQHIYKYLKIMHQRKM